MRPQRVLALLAVLALSSLALVPTATARDTTYFGWVEQADRDNRDRDTEPQEPDGAHEGEWAREGRGDDPGSGELPSGSGMDGDDHGLGGHSEEANSQDAERDGAWPHDIRPDGSDHGGDDPGDVSPETSGMEPPADDDPSEEYGDRPDGPPGAPDWDPMGDECTVAIEIGGDDDAWDGPTGDLIPMLRWSIYWLKLLPSGIKTP